MNIKIDDDLLTAIILYCPPSNFETFHCVIESQNVLLKPETLWIITKESDAWWQSDDSETFMANHF